MRLTHGRGLGHIFEAFLFFKHGREIMDYREIEALIGKELADPAVKAFLEKVGIPYPKKDTISASASDWYFWLIGKKSGLELLFSIDVLNRKYAVRQAERKGAFRPILTSVHFTEKAQVALPHQITYASKLDALRAILGEPTRHPFFKDSLIWNVLLYPDREIEFHLEYRADKDEIRNMAISIRKFRDIFRLYYTQYGETIESTLKESYVYDEQEIRDSKRVSVIYNKAAGARQVKRNLFFILWAVDNGYLDLGEAFRGDIEKLRAREIDILEFAAKAFKDNPFVTTDDFACVDKEFVWSYCHNLPSREWYYRKDFESTFARETEELKIADEISRLPFSEENRRLISGIINKRYDEFRTLQKTQV
jgi:hypothetical protein